ncbi:MAG: MBOAT family O-acyltransferase [Candidatus Sericytochromatia bacterium]
MIFNEALYPLFLLIAVPVFFAVPLRWRASWITLTGLAFYAYYADAFLLLFGAEALVVYALMQRWRTRRDALWLGIVLSVGVLVYYKYRNLALLSWAGLQQLGGQSHGIPTVEHLILPLAISFFTFEFIHYLVDSHQGKIEPHRLSDYLAFIVFFPTMIAGPIKRFQDFVPKLNAARFSWQHVSAGSWRILIGAAKKIIIADSLDPWIQPLLSGDLQQQPAGVLWVALLAYSVKIYVDFSGYSDMAIGSARLFGIVVPENFNWPYLQANIGQFWRHWHISLTSWITDYVFKPLGGSRVGLPRTLLNTLIAMGVSGIWHGAAWHFLVWGLYHGVLLGLNRLWRTFAVPHLPVLTRFPRSYRVVSTLLTFVCVTLGWGLFILPVSRFLTLLQRLVGL